ncbi:MAG: response regulator [Thermoguttaceae bacterium]
MHVLLVEDSPINRRFIGLALAKAGIEVTDAENGRVGVDMAATGLYDAVLMDMQMPILDGFEATSLLRQMGLSTPIIALTGHGSDEDRRRCREAGCTDHLVKPVEGADLVAALNRAAAATFHLDEEDSSEFDAELRLIALDYLRVQRQRLGEMAALLESGSYAELARLAHRIKGTAGTVGLCQFTGPAERLEAAALADDRQTCGACIDGIAELQSRAEMAVEAGEPSAE